MTKEKIFYFDEEDNLIKNSDNVVKIIIQEEDENGNLVRETVLFKKQNESN